MISQVQADGVLQCTRAAVAPAANLLLRQLCEPTLHLVDPGRVRGCEVQVEAGVSEQPTMDERRLMRAVVVQDKMLVHDSRPLSSGAASALLSATTTPVER